MTAPLIQLIGINRSYGTGEAMVRALDTLNLQIDAGEFVAIMGPSGSGKSTAMNLIGCLDRPSSGQYLFNGVEVANLNQDQRALLRRHYLGFVFQGFNLLARTSAQENVELPLIYKGMAKDERQQRARAALARVGLVGRENHEPSQLSGGQQQRVAIARALASQPMVLLADEPTGNLDTKRSEEIMQLLVALNREEGLTSIMVTHEENMAAHASRLVTFLDGKLAGDVRTDRGGL